MKVALHIIKDSPYLSDEVKQMAVSYEAAVQWYLATCEAIATGIDFSPLVDSRQQQVAA